MRQHPPASNQIAKVTCKMAKPNISVDELRSEVNYDPSTGLMTWKRGGKQRVVGERVGSFSYGYLQTCINGYRMMVHAAAWAYVHGTWHQGHIDHINGDKQDNRLSNLRAVDCSTNLENLRKARSDNKTGYLGVAPHPCVPNRYTAQIHTKGKKIHLGCFCDPSEAHQAYLQAKRRLHAGCTI